MGFDCPLVPLFRTTYRASVSAHLIEHELVHVFGGRFDGSPRPDPGEVEAWRWETTPAIAAEIAARPERYSVWFRRYITEFGDGLVLTT
jgi:isopentenyl-diphosphate delta-isomerase